MRIARFVSLLVWSSAFCACLALIHPARAESTTTTLAITAAGVPVTSTTRGHAITLTATVVAGSTPVSPGLVKFCDATAVYCTDIHIAGTAQLNAAGSATLHVSPGVGSHAYKAVFVGTNRAAASTSISSSLVVTGRTMTGSFLTSTGSARDYTLIATVAGSAAAGPTGEVSFFNTQDALIGTGTLGPSGPALNLVAGPVAQTSSATSVMVTADFNGDGQADLALVSPSTNTVAIWLGDGAAKFTSGATVPTGATPQSIVAADFNADGKVDLAVSNAGGTTVTILLGNGDGTFTSGAAPVIGTKPVYLVSADFNGDGNADLAVAYDSSEIAILFGKGDGTFSAGPITPLPGAEDNMVTGDFNSDGKVDVAVPSGPGEIFVMLGNGDGTFSSTPTSHQRSGYILEGDFNQDGKTDLVLLSEATLFQMFLGNGDGTFAAATNITTGMFLGSAAAGDFNGDGKPDLAVIDTGSYYGAVTILLGNGDGSFTASTSTSNGLNVIAPGPILATDFNGDSTPDIVFFDAFSSMAVFETETRSAVASITGINVPLSVYAEDFYAKYLNDGSNMGSQSTQIQLSALSASLSPSSITFAPTRVGRTAAYHLATLTNTGNGLLNTSIHIYASNDTFIIRDQTCGATLAAGASCTFNVVFTPFTYGSLSGSATATEVTGSYSLVANLILGLSGTGLAEDVKFTPASLTFPATLVGDTAGYRKILLTNPGTLPLTLRSIAITNTTDFYSWGIRDQTCGSTVAPGAACSFEIAFRPTRTGAITAEVSVDDMLGTWQQKIPLSGTGK